MSVHQTVRVGDRNLRISNLTKILWPRAGFTKADLLAYHTSVASWALPHWHNRPLTVTRYPHGVSGPFFFQKNIPPGAPAWVETKKVGEVEYILANDLATIAWLANLGAVEFHPATYQLGEVNVPSYAVIDLDPTPPAGFKEAVQAALRLRDVLSELNLRGYPKLSGKEGIHIFIPLLPEYDFKVTEKLVRLVGAAVVKKYPNDFTLERLIKNRRGIYIDYLQNHPAKTIVGVYSPRPTPEATVSMALDWADLPLYEPRDFTIKTGPSWLKERGDLFLGVQCRPQSLLHLLGFFNGDA